VLTLGFDLITGIIFSCLQYFLFICEIDHIASTFLFLRALFFIIDPNLESIQFASMPFSGLNWLFSYIWAWTASVLFMNLIWSWVFLRLCNSSYSDGPIIFHQTISPAYLVDLLANLLWFVINKITGLQHMCLLNLIVEFEFSNNLLLFIHMYHNTCLHL